MGSLLGSKINLEVWASTIIPLHLESNAHIQFPFLRVVDRSIL